jgi:hypothetical protein
VPGRRGIVTGPATPMGVAEARRWSTNNWGLNREYDVPVRLSDLVGSSAVKEWTPSADTRGRGALSAWEKPWTTTPGPA